jgi:hypothetical protein
MTGWRYTNLVRSKRFSLNGHWVPFLFGGFEALTPIEELSLTH